MDERTPQPVDTEVVGRFTLSQLHELNILSGAIFGETEFDREDENHRIEVVGIVKDAVMRGLSIRDRVWMSPHEKVSSYFELGVKERLSITEKLHTLAGEEDRHYVTQNELREAQKVKPLNADFQSAEELLNTISRRKKSVMAFHSGLFKESRLVPQAQELQEASDSLHRSANEEEEFWKKNNRLFANFLIHMGWYRRPGLTVEPQDIAALFALWESPTARDQGKKFIIEEVNKLAADMQLPPEDIAVYTAEFLDQINFDYMGTELTVDLLESRENFALPQSQLNEERTQHEQSYISEKEVVEFSQDEIKEAQNQVEGLKKLFQQVDQLVLDTPDPEEGEMDQLDVFFDTIYKPYMRALSPVSVYLAYREALNLKPKEENYAWNSARIQEELDTDVLITTQVKVYELLETRLHQSAENKKRLPEFDEVSKEQVLGRVQGIILNKLTREDLSESLYSQLMTMFPPSLMEQYLTNTDVSKLSVAERELLYSLDTNRWVSFALYAGIRADTVEFGLIYLSDFLKGFFEGLPAGKKADIVKALTNTIDF